MSRHLKLLSTFISIIIVILFTSTCGVSTHIPSEHVNVRDSVVLNIIDSTVYHPVEVIKDVVPSYDTLRLETSLASAEAYVDTSLHVLKGSIQNKKDVVYKYKVITKTEYKDSIQIKEIPVEVEKIVKQVKHPWYESVLVLFALIGLTAIVIKIIKLYVKKV